MHRTFLATLLTVLTATSTFAGVALTSARIYKKQGEIAKSIQFYDEAVVEEPGNADVLFERGEILGLIAMDDEQVGLRKKLAGDAVDPQRALLERMVTDFDAVRSMSDDKKAKKLIKKIDTLLQDYWWEFYSKAVATDSAYRANAQSFENNERTAIADRIGLKEDVKAVFLSDDEAADSIFAAFQTRVLETGLEAAQTSIMLDPKHWSSRFVFAQLLGFKVKDDQYVKAWNEALEALENSNLKSEEPENYKTNREYARLQLIQYFYASEDYVNTLAVADKMLADDPGSIEAVQYKAFSLATMANEQSLTESSRDSLKRVALRALDMAKESNPSDENILYYIGQFNLQLKDTAAALQAFDEYLTRSPADRDVLFTQGLIYLEGDKFGDWNKAAEKFGTIKDNDPDDGAAWINYGIALIRLGKNEEGATAVKKGEKLSGN